MIKPKKSARELWNQLGLRNHIKQAFQETTWGQIVDSNKKNQVLLTSLQTQRSMSEYTIAQKLKEQHNSFLINKEKQPTKTFLEDQFEKVFTEKQDWKQLALENEKSQVSPLTKRSSNDQTFSPINRVKIDESQQYQSIPKDICKLPGHENNQYKFICIDSDCPYKLQKACAHCVIKMHTKHVSQMREIESYEELIEQNIKRAQELIDQSQQLLTALSKPFDEYFQLIKNHITALIDSIQQKLLTQNKEKLQKLVQSEVEIIQNMNSKFEAFKLMNTLIPDESINEYQRLLANIREKMKIECNLEQISRPIENYLYTLMSDKKVKDQSETTDILQQLMTSNRDSNRESLVHHHAQSIHQSPLQTKKTVQRVMGTASPLNVFNRQISNRQIPTKITYPIVYYRTNS